MSIYAPNSAKSGCAGMIFVLSIMLSLSFAGKDCKGPTKQPVEPELIEVGKVEETPSSKADMTETVAQQPELQKLSAELPQIDGDTITTETGLKYIDMKVGYGASPEPSQTCVMHYTGWLTDGKKFDSSRDRGKPLQFPIGQGLVIKGFDEGVASMKVGGQRLLIISPELGYGPRGHPSGKIPGNSTLFLDVELLEVK